MFRLAIGQLVLVFGNHLQKSRAVVFIQGVEIISLHALCTVAEVVIL